MKKIVIILAIILIGLFAMFKQTKNRNRTAYCKIGSFYFTKSSKPYLGIKNNYYKIKLKKVLRTLEDVRTFYYRKI